MLPKEFQARMQSLLGAQYDAFLASYERPFSAGLRFNACKVHTIPQLEFLQEPIPWARDGYYYRPDTRPGLHPYHQAGAYYLQEPSAMAPAALLDAQPGELVLDLCAAPGGKSTQIAAQMRNKGLLICNEIHPQRAKALSQNIERMGIANALVLNERPDRLAARFVRCFDRVLVDAPCSGEGMFRKEEAAVTDWSEDTVRRCAARQLEILNTAAGMLKSGGRLVYSTCTFAPEENEGVVSAFLKQHPDFALLPPSIARFAPGRPDWVPNPAPNLEYTCRLWPHLLRGEGHFAAVLQYQGEECQPLPAGPGQACPTAWSAFSAETLTAPIAGKFLFFGETVYAAPEQTPNLDGLKVLRAGLELGQVRKGRLIPAHALALHLNSAASELHLSAESVEIHRYLQGQTLPAERSGWTLVFADDYSLGWAKGSDGVLKNHYPKGLRR